MAYTDILDNERFCFGFADQSNLTTKSATAIASYTYLDATFPDISEDGEVDDEKRSVKGRGTVSKVSVGRVRYPWSFKCEMPGQLTTYNPTLGAPSLVGAWQLVAEALGANAAGAYLAAGVAAASTAKLINWASTTPKLGCGYVVGTGLTDGLVKSIGWLKSLAVQAGTLFQDMRASPVTGDNIYQTVTMFPGITNPTPKTFGLFGEHAYQSIKGIGAMPMKLTFSWDKADKLWCQFDYVCYGGQAEDADGGTIVSPQLTKVLEPAKGTGAARIMVASNRITSFFDGTADPDGTCGLRNLQLTLDFSHYANECVAKAERVDAVKVRSPKCSLSFWAPRVTDLQDPTYTPQDIWHAALERQHQVSFSYEMGDTIGQLFGLLIPGGLIRTRPTPAIQDGAWGWNVVLDAGDYQLDGASTDAGNSGVRLMIG